ncbi:hypothetical protein WJ36_13410 [Burkholderia ubonensis]|nr:hypothetical protein WJ36_13410 [Burkholderia ubonensis]
MAFAPGSPSPLRPRNPPRRAIKRSTSLSLGLGRLLDVGEQIRAANFIGIEEQFGIEIGATTAQAH